MKKVAIVVGHTKLKPGACSPYGIPCENIFNSEIARYLECIADIYYYDSYNLGYTSMVKRNAAKINKKDYGLVIELHYNAATPQAHGCETLYYYSNREGKEIAEKFSEAISKEFNVKNRGAKALVNKKDRGFAAVYYTKPTTILLEPFFGSNKEDSSKFKGKEFKYAQLIKKLIKEL